ncbi:unnamed protein product, partial [marine sediment metagenome]
MPEEKRISPAIIIPVGLSLGLIAAVGVYALARAAPPVPPEGYICPHCGNTFDIYEDLAAHIQSEHPLGIVLDFPQLTILSVEGMPFIDTGVEPLCTLGYWMSCLLKAPTGAGVTDAEALTQCLLDQGVDPRTCTADQLYNGLTTPDCMQYLKRGPYATLERAAWWIVAWWISGPGYKAFKYPARAEGTIVFV